MPNGGKITYQVDFKTNQASIQSLEKSLQRIQTASTKSLTNGLTGNDAIQSLKNIQNTAKQVGDALKKSLNEGLGSLNVSEFNKQLNQIGIAKIQNDFSQLGTVGKTAFTQIATQALTTNLQLKQTTSLLDKMGQTFVNTVKWNIAASAVNSFTGSVQSAFGYIKNLDQSLTNIRIVTGDSREEMARFAKQANNAAQALGRSTLDYTKAALTFYQQGLSDEDVQARTQATLMAQNVTGSGEEMADYLTAVWNGYKVANEQAELYVDKLALVADSSASNMSQLAVAMSKVASTANAMGVDVDQLNAQIATIIATTRQAPESVGNALKTIYSRINDIATGADDAEISLGNYSKKMAQVGFNVLDTNGNLRDTGEVIQQIGGKWASLSKEQQIYLARTMAGQRQYNNLIALFDNWSNYIDLVNVSMNSQGSLIEKNDRYLESLAAHLKQLKDAEQGVIQAFADGDSFKGFIDAGTAVLNIFSKIIQSIGGGGNALLMLGGIATQVFSKQIAKELNNVIINFQNLRSNAQALRQDRENTKNWAKSVGISNNIPVSHLIENKENIQQYYGVLSNDQITQATDTAKQIALLQNEVQVWKANQREAQAFVKEITGIPYTFKQIEEGEPFSIVQGSIENAKIQLKATRDALKDFFRDLSDSSKNKIDTKNMLFGVLGISSQNPLGDLSKIPGIPQQVKDSIQTTVLEIDKLEQNGQDASRQYEKLGHEIQQAMTAGQKSIKNYNSTVEQSSEKIKQQTSALDLLKNKLKQIEEQGKQLSKVQTFTSMFGALTQLTGVINSLKNIKNIFNDQTISSGEKASQIFSNITSTGMSVVMMLPQLKTAFAGLSGMVGGPWAAAISIGLGVLVAVLPSVVSWFDKLIMTSKQAEKAIQDFNKKQRQLNQSLKENTSQQESLKNMKEDWDALSEKAGQYGKNIDSLTQDQKKRYFEVSNAIAQMNSDAVLAYDSQGNAILKNNSALEDTIELLKQQIKLQTQALYTSQEFQDQQKANKQKRKEAEEDLKNYQGQLEALNDISENDKNSTISDQITQIGLMASQNSNEKYQQWLLGLQQSFRDFESNGYNEAEINQLIKDIADSEYYSTDENLKTIVETLQNFTEKKKEELIKLINLSQEKFDELNKIATSDIITVLRGNKDFNDSYFKVAEIFGENAISSFIQGLNYSYENMSLDEAAQATYENLLKILEDNFSEQSFNKLKEETSKGFNEIFNQRDQLSVYEYQSQLSTLVQDTIKNNSQLVNLAENNPELLEQILSLLFPDLKDISLLSTGVSIKTAGGENKNSLISALMTSLAPQDRSDQEEIFEAVSPLTEPQLQNWSKIVDYAHQIYDDAKKTGEGGITLRDAIKAAASYSANLLSDEDLKNIQSLQDLNTAFNNGQLGIGPEAFQKYQSVLDEVLKKDAKARGLNQDTIKTHAETLEELGQINEDYSTDLKDNIALTTQLAMDHQEMNKGLQQLGKSWKDLSKELADSTYGTAEYAETITKLKQIMGQVLNVDPEMLSSNFIQENLDNIKLAAQGDIEAIQRLRDAAAQDIAANFTINPQIDEEKALDLSNQLTNLTGELQNWLNQQEDQLKIGTKIDFDNTDYLQKFNQLINDAGLTASQVQAYFDAMGYQANLSTTTTKQTIRHTGVYPYVVGGNPYAFEEGGQGPQIIPIKYQWTEQADVSVPQIQSINYKGPVGKTINFGNTRAGKASTPKSSGRSGSTKKPSTQKQSKDTRDAYHDVNRQLDKQEDKIKDIQDSQKKLLDKDRLDNIKQQNEQLEKQKDLLSQKQGIAQGQLIRIRNELVVDTNGNVKFDGKQIANYNQMLENAEKVYNNYINYYNTLTAEQQQAAKNQLEAEKEKYDRIKNNAQEYEKTLDLLNDIGDQQEEIANQIYQNRIQLAKLNVQLAESVGDREREWLEFEKQYIKKLSDQDIFGNSLASMKEIASYMDSEEIKKRAKEVEELQKQIAIMQLGGLSNIYGDDLKSAQERLDELIKAQQDDLKTIQGLVDDIKDNYLKTIDQAKEKMDDQIDQYERINDLWQHQSKMTELLFGDTAFDTYDKISQQQEQNAKLQENMLRSQVIYWKEMMDNEIAGSDAWEKMRENWENAVDDLNSHLEDMIDNLHKKVQKNIDGIVFNINLRLTNGKGLDLVNQEWDAISDFDDTFLDPFNTKYGIKEIEDLYESGLESLTGNVPAQRRLNDLMNDQLKILHEKDKLTQYDIDRAKALYEIEMKRFALEDAQSNKTKMRLRRDSQGNYTYQYVADQNAVAQAQKELADAQRELYNSDKQAYRKNLDQLYDVYENYMSQMTELTKQYNQTQDEAERARIQNRIDLLKSSTKDLMEGLTDNESYYLNYVGGSFLEQNGLDALTEQQLEIIKENVPYVNSEIKELKENIVGEGGILPATASAWKDISEAIQASDAAVRDILTEAGTSLQDVAAVINDNDQAFDKNIAYAKDMLQANQELIDSCNAEIQAMQNLLSLLDQFIEKVVNATANIDSLRSAYNLAQSLDGSGLTADNIGVAGTGANTTLNNGYSGNVPSDTASLKVAINNILAEYEQFLSKLPIAKFDTGGLTGSWNDVDGRLAILHSKQLVLNKDDTANILSVVNTVRNMAGALDGMFANELRSRISGIGGIVNTINPNNELDQNVHIEATFPNVREHREIEQAFNNLVNIASMKASSVFR